MEERHSPALLLVGLVAHVFRELLDLVPGLGVVAFDNYGDRSAS